MESASVHIPALKYESTHIKRGAGDVCSGSMYTDITLCISFVPSWLFIGFSQTDPHGAFDLKQEYFARVFAKIDGCC